MIVTTTNSIEGREISRYNDPIAANVVIGTNVFSDIGASYVDLLCYIGNCYCQLLFHKVRYEGFIFPRSNSDIELYVNKHLLKLQHR
ncbi:MULTISPECIES: heavy metal-binding domain-containing protein [Sphingobacterium]|uniref:heavy metal-binding domain-containing protein n=1 Tax=Sphingobacterium TaxID=28453 RepID=UPI0035E3D4C9